MSGEHVWQPGTKQVVELNQHFWSLQLESHEWRQVASAVISASPYPRIAEALEGLLAVHVLGQSSSEDVGKERGNWHEAIEARAALAALKEKS